MIDSEKVLIGLKLCTSQSICETCPYYHDCWDDTDSEQAVPLMRDALELLKELDSDKILNGLERLERVLNCQECPTSILCGELLPVALKIIKEQDKIIAEYHKADSFLAAHGWKWTNAID